MDPRATILRAAALNEDALGDPATVEFCSDNGRPLKWMGDGRMNCMGRRVATFEERSAEMISEQGGGSSCGSSCGKQGEEKTALGHSGEPERKRPILAGAKGVKNVYVFLPLADITAGDVSEVLNLVVLGVYVKVGMVPPKAVDDVYEQMTERGRRHIRVVESPKVLAPNHDANKLQLPPGM